MRRDVLRPVMWGALAVALALALSAVALMQYARAPSEIPRSVALSDALAKANEQIRIREQRIRALDEQLREDLARLQSEVEANRLAAAKFPRSIDLRAFELDRLLEKVQERTKKVGEIAKAGEPYLPPEPPRLDPPFGAPMFDPQDPAEQEDEVQFQLADKESAAPGGDPNAPDENRFSAILQQICCSMIPREDSVDGLRELLQSDIEKLKRLHSRLIVESASQARFEGQAQAWQAAQAQLAASLATLMPLPPRDPPVAIPDNEEKWVPLWLAALTILGSVLVAAVGTGFGTWMTMRARL